MRLIDGLQQLRGSPVTIPGASRDELPEVLATMGLMKGVEIGVYKAEFTEKFAQAGLQITGVDPWLSYEDHIEGRQHREDFLYRHAQRVMKSYPNTMLIRKTSMEAVIDVPLASLDFVYIDGNHGFKYVAEDLWEWSKRVRTGGIVAGHDWGHKPHPRIDSFCLHVTPTVRAYIECMHIENWYVIGRTGPSDKWRSFLWLKP